MGLHKNLLVDRANLPAEFICSLCAHILLQPYQVFCSQDHVFCQACLDSYVEDCIVDRPSEDNRTNSDQIHQHGSASHHGKAMASQEMEPIPARPTLSEETAVACPECSRVQEQPELLRISSFRPAKFIQRIVSTQTIRCPTTMARSCQWTGPMEDVETHLGVCGFAVEYHCPHHQFGCSFRGTVIDIVAHMPACLFCAEDRSVDTTRSGTLDDSHLSHLSNPLNGPPSPPQSSPILETMHSPVDPAHTPVQGQKPDREAEFTQIALDEFDQDEFSGLLEDMDMTDLSDLTTSHGPTPTLSSFQGSESDQERVRDQGYGSVPACIKDSRSNQKPVREQTQPQKQTATPPPQILVHVYDESQKPSTPSFSEIQQSQATVPPTPYPRRRRRLIDEEPSQITSEEADVIQDERPQGDKTAAEISKDINTCAVRPVAPSPARSRVLQEIPTPLPNCRTRLTSSPETYDYVGSSQQSTRLGEAHHPLPRKLKLRLKLRQPRSPSSTPPIPQPTAVDRRVLQFQGSWPWEVHRCSSSSLSEQDESSPIVTLADISTVASPVSMRSLSPSSPTSEFARFASMARHTTVGPSQSAEPHAFLPLLTHEPRYLRSRRRKVLRGRTYSGSSLPSVHSVYERCRGKLWTEPITPDITSPENSFSCLRGSIASSAHNGD